MTDKPSTYKRLFLGLVFVTGVIYAFGLNGDFIIDDRTYFIDNDILPSMKPWEVCRFFLEPSNYWGEHLPLRDIFYAMQYNLFGLHPFGYHLVSLVLYLLMLICVRCFLAQVQSFSTYDQESKDQGITLLILAFFALHPTHVESVSYISGQKDLLCGLFSILAMNVFMKMAYEGGFSGLRVGLFIASYYAAFLSKGLAVSTGLMITVMSFLVYQDRKALYREWLPRWVLINLPVLAWLLYVFSERSRFKGSMDSMVRMDLIERVDRAIRLVGAHVKLALFPTPLNFGYPYAESVGIDLFFVSGLISIILLAAFFIILRNLLVRMGVLIVGCYLLPVSQLLNTLHNAAVYDRYIFIPVLGLAMIVGGLIQHGIFSRHKKYIVSGLLVIVSICAILTVRYIPVYKSNLAVFEHAYRTFPEWNATSFNYTYVLIEEKRFQEAESMLAKEQQLQSPKWVADFFKGMILLEKEEFPEAIDFLRRSYWNALAGRYYPFAGVPLARALIMTGSEEQARIILRPVLNSKIKNPLMYYKAKTLIENLR